MIRIDYLFNNRMKVLIHDGLGDLALRPTPESGQVPLGWLLHDDRVELSPEQVTALVQGLPWQCIGPAGAISVL